MPMRKTFLALLLAGAATVLFTQDVFAQEKNFDLKISHWVPASHPLQKALEDWAASVEKASGGTIKSKVFPAQQLGKAFDHYDMARDGIADVTYVNPGYDPGVFPIIGAGELPFLMSDAKGGSEGLDAWYRKYAEKEMKDVKFCLAFIHSPSSFHSRTKKIVVPEDIKGLRIRPAHATMGNFVTLLGGTNVQSSAPEVRDIIERGVADAVTFPWGSLVLFGVDKVKAEAGHEVYKLTPDQLALWKKAAEPLVKTWADGVKAKGVDPDAAMAELKASLAKYNALTQ